MVFYDSKGNEVEFKGTRLNLLGANGEILSEGNGIVYKKYFSFAEHRIKQSIFDFIKEIDNPHMVKLLERYYLAEEISDFDTFYQNVNSPFIYDCPYNNDAQKVDLYTYKWVPKEYIDILEQSVEYLLFNLNDLLLLADYFSNHRIRIADMRTDNMVCNKNNIVLIDPDMYSFVSSNIDALNLRTYNRKLILMTIKNLCAKLTEYKSPIIETRLRTLFQESISHPNIGITPIIKKLRGCKMPIDYIIKSS